MNSGKIIKVLGIIFIFIMLLLVVISFSRSVVYINDFEMRRTELGPDDILLLALALIASVIPGTMIYGFGALIDSNISMNQKMDTLIANTRQSQTPRYEPPAPQPAYNPQPGYPPAPVYAPPAPSVQAAAPAPTAAPAAPIIDEPTMVFPVLGDLNQQSPVTDIPVTEESTGWTCGNCGAHYPTLTPFCRNCGNKRV